MSKQLNLIKFNDSLKELFPEMVDRTNSKLIHRWKNYRTRLLPHIDKIILHHTGHHNNDLSVYERHHVKTNNWPSLGYHFVIDANGVLFYYNHINRTTYHCKGQNSSSIAIALVGDFTKTYPKSNQIEQLKDLLTFFALYFHEVDVCAHNQFRATACPGNNFPINDMISSYTNSVFYKKDFL